MNKDKNEETLTFVIVIVVSINCTERSKWTAGNVWQRGTIIARIIFPVCLTIPVFARIHPPCDTHV